MTLNELNVGEMGKIKYIDFCGEIYNRLSDLGFLENSYVRCEDISLFGDPKSFSINGIVIALRSDILREIHIVFVECENE